MTLAKLETDITAPPPRISEIQHRVVQARGKRYSLKLETAYWEFLESLAEERGTRLGELLSNFAAQAPKDVNFASTLRRICLEEAIGEARDQQAPLKINLATTIAAFPNPALIIAHDGRIVGANAAFGQWMHAKPEASTASSWSAYFKSRRRCRSPR